MAFKYILSLNNCLSFKYYTDNTEDKSLLVKIKVY